MFKEYALFHILDQTDRSVFWIIFVVNFINTIFETHTRVEFFATNRMAYRVNRFFDTPKSSKLFIFSSPKTETYVRNSAPPNYTYLLQARR